MERDDLAVIIMFATDVVLVLTMFFGLLRLRGQDAGMFGIARILWKQVRNRQFVVVIVPSAFLMYMLFARALSGSFFPQGPVSFQ
jgi:hypothetical protein